ncbi:MAG: AAA domain-containing protein, partial [Verrucomicrobia bacterium]|nr:AAA domain-containing protein [Verrucomicrobiota bacterium]
VRVQILAYDPTTGAARLAAEDPPVGSSGQLIIDFKWLIRRVHQWLEAHGANVKNPFESMAHSPSVADDFRGAHDLIAEKLTAIRGLLKHPVSYVWGPPGTGKTRHVLAATVAHLLSLGKKILVTAPTNLAVDNALDAILSVDGVERAAVLRIGIPSSEFRDKWRDCCEEKAFQEQLTELKHQHDLLIERHKAGLRTAELNAIIPCLTREIELETNTAIQATFEAKDLGDDLFSATTDVTKMTLDCTETAKLLSIHKSDLAALAIPERRKAVDALETEQAALIQEKHVLVAEACQLSWWKRTFTDAKSRSESRLAQLEQHSSSVELTLLRQRAKLTELETQMGALDQQINHLSKRLIEGETMRQQRILDVARLKSQISKCTEQANRAEAAAGRAEEERRECEIELEQLEGLGNIPSDDVAFFELEKEMDSIAIAMSKITQNLDGKLVLGMTLDGFVGLTMHQSLNFDHVIVDEAGYAPLAKVIPVCSLRCPISLLGDHCQLPPVYQGKNHPQSECYWGTSALYLEEAFKIGVGDCPASLLNHANEAPMFQLLHKSVLTQTFRFGSNLATLVDRHFYDIGLNSQAVFATTVEIVDCPPSNPPAAECWQNFAEAEAVVERAGRWLDWQSWTVTGQWPISCRYLYSKRQVGHEYSDQPGKVSRPHFYRRKFLASTAESFITSDGVIMMYQF